MILLAAIGIIGSGIPLWLRRLRAEKHRLLLARQLRESIRAMAYALRVGVSFPQALQYAAREGADPLAQVWRGCVARLSVGWSLDQVIGDLPAQVSLGEMRWFVAAVQITHRTGGSLAGVLETLAASLQEKELLRERIAAATAQGKASGVLISLMPFLVMGSLWLMSPEMAAPMFRTAAGQTMLAGILLNVAVGGWLIQRIVTIPVE